METYTRSRARAGAASILASLFLAVVLISSLAPSLAFSVEGTAGSAALQISRGENTEGNYSSDVSKTYEFYKDATLEDLLKAAVAAGDVQSYVLSDYGFPDAIVFSDGITVANAADFSVYWSSAIDGNASAEEFNAGNYSSIALADGRKYQIVLTAYPGPTDYSFFDEPTPSSQVAGNPQAVVTTDPTDEQGDNQTSQSQVEPSKRTVDEDVLFNNVANSYAGTGFLTNAMDLARACLMTANQEALIETALQTVAAEPSGSIARAILALTANAIDPKAVLNGAQTVDLVDALAHNAAANDETYISVPAFTLLAYECGPHAVPSDALKSKEELIAMLLASQNENGSYGYGDVDTTAMVVTALAPYRDRATVLASIEKALTHLKGQQLADGGFTSSYGDTTKSNSNSVATVIVMLCACGIDPSAEWRSIDGISPYENLLSFANDELTAFSYDGGADDAYATEQGFLAMVAYKGLQKKDGEAYNVYIDDVCTVDNAATEITRTPQTTKPQLQKTAQSTQAQLQRTAQTSDAVLPLYAMTFTLIVAAALMCFSARRVVAQMQEGDRDA